MSNDNQAAVLENYVVFQTPFGNDSDFSFDLIQKDNKVVAIKINLDEQINTNF